MFTRGNRGGTIRIAAVENCGTAAPERAKIRERGVRYEKIEESEDR
jgi:hypothetical protein